MRDPEDTTCMNSGFQRKRRGTGLTMTLDPKASLKPGCSQRRTGWQGLQRSLSNPLCHWGQDQGTKRNVICLELVTGLDWKCVCDFWGQICLPWATAGQHTPPTPLPADSLSKAQGSLAGLVFTFRWSWKYSRAWTLGYVTGCFQRFPLSLLHSSLLSGGH